MSLENDKVLLKHLKFWMFKEIKMLQRKLNQDCPFGIITLRLHKYWLIMFKKNSKMYLTHPSPFFYSTCIGILAQNFGNPANHNSKYRV